MDEVKALFAIQPGLGKVVNLKVEVGGNHRRLRRAEVGSQYLQVLDGDWDQSCHGVPTSHEGYLSAKSLWAAC